MRVFEAFAGIGAWGKALTRLGIPHEIVGFSEINKYAIQAYCALHGISPELNYGDIRDITNPPEIDLLCASPPCQSWSSGGRQEGADDERGQLFFDTLDFVKLTRPKYICFENVKGITQKKHTKSLNRIRNKLMLCGYNLYEKVLCAADYGVPQMRQRLFIVCIRQDCDDGLFSFPEPYPLTTKLSDLLEPEVDEKYFERSDRYIQWKEKVTGDFPKLSCLGYFDGRNSQSSRIYADHTACTLTALGGGGGVKTGYYAVSCDRKNGVGKPIDIAYTLTSSDCGLNRNQTQNAVLYDDWRIRRLTPLEVLRVMDFDDADYHLLRGIGTSDAQFYRLGGNSICVNVICEIFKNLFKTEVQHENNDKNQPDI